MKKIGEFISKKYINVNNDIINNDNNVKRYSLNKKNFHPNTPEASLAEEIATYFNDTNNYAFHLSVVNKLGREKAYRFYRMVRSRVEDPPKKYPIRSPKKYYAWCYRNLHTFGL